MTAFWILLALTFGAGFALGAFVVLSWVARKERQARVLRWQVWREGQEAKPRR